MPLQWLKRGARSILERVPLVIPRRAKLAPSVRMERFDYQRRYVDFQVQPGERVLDIGSGHHPFPYATVLCDRFLEPTAHRTVPLQRRGKPLVAADVTALPVRDQAFDFVYCSHILEHVEDPLRACAELMRVARRGYIETPTITKDVLMAWARNQHKWHVVQCGGRLCFFEYTVRQLEGIRSSAWRDVIMNRWTHPLQKAFWSNQDLFNTMFPWSGSFGVAVYRLDGTVQTLNH